MAEQVYHPKYGRGTVKQTRNKGFWLQVVFEEGITRWLRFDEIKLAVPKPSVTRELPPLFSDESMKSRRVIEAFRLGIVPYDSVLDFTFGREEETRAITHWLRSSDKNSMFIIGTYGTGKTHLLHYLLALALQDGFAVAWVEMDPNETPFHNPKLVYRRLVQTFRYRSRRDGQPRGFRQFLKEALDKRALTDHKYFGCLYHTSLTDDVWEWIEARNAHALRPSGCGWFPCLYSYANAGNIYCYLLSGLGWAAREALGLKGLVLVFDEAETINWTRYQYQTEKGFSFWLALVRISNDEEKLLQRPTKELGLNYCQMGMGREVPFLYRKPSCLKIAFGFSWLPLRCQFQLFGNVDNAQTLNLEPLKDAAMKEVFEHICLLYYSAYGFLQEDSMATAVLERVLAQGKVNGTRSFVKASVEALDLARYYQGMPLDELLQ